MTTDISEKGLESQIVRHKAGTGGPNATQLGITSSLAASSQFG